MSLSLTSEVRPFSGYVETTADALRLIQAARCGLIPRITRRLNEMERRSMIRSGAVFVFSVDESGIKRWTDGYSWTPSRISGNFLVYREVTDRGSRTAYTSGITDGSQRPEAQITLKAHGLVKKTITVKVDGSDHHLISYFTQDDIRTGRLRRPNTFSDLMSLEIPLALVQSTNFRYPPKLEAGPDGRLTRIRDSEDHHELSESPSPTTTTSRSLSSEDVPFPQGSYSMHGHRSADAHPSQNMHQTPHPSSPLYDAGADPTAMTPSSPHWSSSPYLPYHPPSPTHQGYSSQSKTSMTGYTWNSQNMGVPSPRDLTPDLRSHVRLQNEGWHTDTQTATIPSLASVSLARSTEEPSLPTIRTQDVLRSSSGASAWGWDNTSPVHAQFQMPPSHRSAHRTGGSADQLPRYQAQQR
ncbi:hypothetical protein NM688_g2632 [Phlebia brevispora]|uniref:Uncharacterized protein n=1 Tax=Phlebia brevispora TaxID=194682 RepID=A0ACC1T839_9APHY|nr:hypothetical protein NM688_g2632 [Phlebia brevispora]